MARENATYCRWAVAAATAALVPLLTLGQALIPLGDLRIDLELVADGLTSPVSATNAGDRSGRLFVLEQTGQIRIINKDGELLPDPFLDLSGDIVAAGERGLLGLAFHPDYRRNGRFFVRYSGPRLGAPGEPCTGTSRGCHEEILAEFRVSGDPDRADPSTRRILSRIDEPQANHNAGDVAFGPDGNLYFTLGDGGGAHDGLAANPPSHGPIGNGQNIDTALGAILRIDVDGPPDAGLEYAIPPDNPFAGPIPGIDEIYAYGMRNPYRFSFNDGPGGDGRLFLADVGQRRFEEINVVQRGGNYGWVIREGLHCFDPFMPNVPPANCPATGPHGEPLLDPIAEYRHADGIAVIGGFVYRGSAFPELVDKYIFGDFSRTFAPANGRLFWIDTNGSLADIFEFRLGPDNRPLGKYLLGFGEDENGEIHVLTRRIRGTANSTGEVWHLLGPPPPDQLTLCHLPPGKPDGAHTIVVSTRSFPAHLAHGDSVGGCR